MPPRPLLASLIPLAVSLLAPASGRAQTSSAEFDKSIDQTVGNHVKVHQLLTDLQRPAANHNPAGVAALVHYPIKVNPGKPPFTVKDQKAFVKDYDRIITPDISDVILKQK